jgi:hypothetical protein
MKLILHIGLEKTGSTALQEYFYNCVDQSYGPFLANQRELFSTANHFDLTVQHALDSSKLKNIQRYSTVKRNVIRDWVCGKRKENIFFTNEHISSRLSEFEEFENLINTLSSGEHDITILLVTRKYEDWIKSKYIEAVKGGYPLEYNEYLNRGGRWHKKELDVERLMSFIYRLPVKLKVMEYNSNIVNDIIGWMNAELGSNFSTFEVPKQSNIRLTAKQTKVKLLLNKLFFLERFIFLNKFVNILVKVLIK